MGSSTAARKSAFSKKGTGQFASISKQTGGPASTKGVTQTSAPSVPSRFVTLPSGKTGTIVDNLPTTIDNTSQPTPTISMSAGFQDKYDQAMAVPSQPPSLTPNNPFVAPTIPLNRLLKGQQAPLPQVANTAQDARGTPLPASAPGIQSQNPIIKAIGNYLNWGDKLGQNADGSYETSIFTPGMALKGAGGKLALNSIKQNKIIMNWAKNFVADASWKLKNKPMAALGATAFLAWFAQEIGATYPFAKGVNNDAVKTLNFAYDDAVKHFKATGDPTLMNEAVSLNAEVTNPLLRTFADKFPFTNTAKAAGRAAKALEFQNRVNVATTNDLVTQKTTGMSDDEMWEKRFADRDAIELELATQKNDAFDLSAANNRRLDLELSQLQNKNYNESRLAGDLASDQIARARSKDFDKARLRQIREEAAFWLEYKKQAIELERLAMEEQGRFWLAYRKQLLRLQEDSGRSHLGFGLLS